jgi:hypothetical protein
VRHWLSVIAVNNLLRKVFIEAYVSPCDNPNHSAWSVYLFLRCLCIFNYFITYFLLGDWLYAICIPPDIVAQSLKTGIYDVDRLLLLSIRSTIILQLSCFFYLSWRNFRKRTLLHFTLFDGSNVRRILLSELDWNLSFVKYPPYVFCNIFYFYILTLFLSISLCFCSFNLAIILPFILYWAYFLFYWIQLFLYCLAL